VPLIGLARRLAQAVKDADATVSNRRIAGMLGVSHWTVNKDLGGSDLPPQLEKASQNNDAEIEGGRGLPPAPPSPPAPVVIIDAAPVELSGEERSKQFRNINGLWLFSADRRNGKPALDRRLPRLQLDRRR
jgi:hypothetical protein